jgi:hypothetical protein
MTELLGDAVFTTGNCETSRSYYFNPAGEPALLKPMTTRAAVHESAQFPLNDYRLS